MKTHFSPVRELYKAQEKLVFWRVYGVLMTTLALVFFYLSVILCR